MGGNESFAFAEGQLLFHNNLCYIHLYRHLFTVSFLLVFIPLECLAIEECATGFCLARGVVTALNGHLLEPSSSMVSFLKLFEPERNCDFPATQGTRRQILQIMHFFFKKKNTSHGNSSFHLGWNFLFRATFGADVSGFFGPYHGPPVQPYPWYFFELVYWVMYDEW